MHKRSLFETQPRQAELCPKCGAALQLKQGKKGLFLGCTAYPACDYLKPLQQSESKILKVLPQACPQCGNPLVLRQGHYGMFIGCSHFPECHYIVHEQAENEAPSAESVPCPSCGSGQLVARRGRQGKVFYACDRFPQCRFNLPHKPERCACPKCGYSLSFQRQDGDYQCCNKACRHQFHLE
ncbi:putative DNA topoisomerase [Pasteurella testudinis DSM 23072]|uniref:Putative DNA topoisomerase n=1 Tax=Pasteurella testudinis DSM 23072 TaxID=1122938 RepID=A0A1W1V289_9PAST|nr:topoisomerase DNA-binding C4 zinc finger domain-containing protein [Pasteurella testudinis]SMB87442.1 putative DNA topoisomerase [Pasteurella testudinis DSM 23072]SUB50550.1 DNA topoisomerase, type IA, zinc finger family protein [Pasteurella testudinis]